MTKSYFTLTVDLPESEAEVLGALLPDWGADALEVRDREAPPMPGVRGPAPGETIVVASFANRADADAAASEVWADFPSAKCQIDQVEDQDWSVAWRSRIRAVEVGRLWVGPPWLRDQAPPTLLPIIVEPKMAFGTGDHPTTRLCLDAVQGFLAENPRASVLDVGCGTGILAIAAAKLGASKVVGIDNDAPSVVLARECAELNGVSKMTLSEEPLSAVPGMFDLVVANILANTLMELAPELARRTRKRLVLAGVLQSQRDEVADAFRREGLLLQPGAQEGEWIRLDFAPGPSARHL